MPIANGGTNLSIACRFLYSLSTQVNDKTGDGTSYTIVYDLSKYNVGSYFDGTTFTAPVSGYYRFNIVTTISDVGAGHTSGRIILVISGTSAFSTYSGFINPSAVRDSNNFVTFVLCTEVFMTAGDTAISTVQVFGSTKTVDVTGSSSSASTYTYFGGELVA